MKRILIPTDFSDNSWVSIRCALTIFANTPMHISLLHIESENAVYETYSGEENQAVLHKSVDHHNRLKKIVNKARNYAAYNQKIDGIQRSGLFIEEIRSIVKVYDIQMIVMSTRGTNIFNPEALGSHTRAVITQVKCTTLVVPQEVPCHLLKQIALLTDYNFVYKAKVINNLLEVATINKAHLNVIHISTDRTLTLHQKDNKQFLKDALQSIKHSFHFMINQTLDEALQFFMDVHKVDMIALLAKNLNFSQNLFFDPQEIRYKSYHARTPFLIIHE